MKKPKKWSEMTSGEQIYFLLEWADKTHKKVEEMVEVINEITDFLHEREGEVIARIEKPKRIIN